VSPKGFPHRSQGGFRVGPGYDGQAYTPEPVRSFRVVDGVEVEVSPDPDAEPVTLRRARTLLHAKPRESMKQWRCAACGVPYPPGAKYWLLGAGIGVHRVTPNDGDQPCLRQYAERALGRPVVG
jgi:hypothetical protein